MRIAVMGAGGVGGYFGARLAHAGHDVAFIARGAHLAAMRERGLSVKSALGDVHLPKPTVTHDPATLGWFDVVLKPFVPIIRLWFDPASNYKFVGGLLARYYRGPEVLMVSTAAPPSAGGTARPFQGETPLNSTPPPSNALSR